MKIKYGDMIWGINKDYFEINIQHMFAWEFHEDAQLVDYAIYYKEKVLRSDLIKELYED
jgi:hypothetical protein